MAASQLVAGFKLLPPQLQLRKRGRVWRRTTKGQKCPLGEVRQRLDPPCEGGLKGEKKRLMGGRKRPREGGGGFCSQRWNKAECMLSVLITHSWGIEKANVAGSLLPSSEWCPIRAGGEKDTRRSQI